MMQQSRGGELAEGKARPSHRVANTQQKPARFSSARPLHHNHDHHPLPHLPHAPVEAAAMEPPAKRLRILQSVEVDEANPDYMRKKQEGQAKLQSRFESIFKKYANMPESMSDEIDMRTGTLVVDRGHLRGLQKRRWKASQFLEDLVADDLSDTPGETYAQDIADDQDDQDDRDELAPRSPEPRLHKPVEEQGAQSVISHNEPPQASQSQDAGPLKANTSASMPVQQLQHVEATNPATPTANLMQLVQFPQTPAGQQAQNTFLSTLTQSINLAVSQAVLTSIARLSGDASTVTELPATSAPFTPSVATDTVPPATNPKWMFPPLPQHRPSLSPVSRTSPLSNPASVRKPRDSFLGRGRNRPTPRMPPSTTPTLVNNSIPRGSNTATEPREIDDSNHGNVDHITVTPVIPRRTRGIKYQFSNEDDIYIIEQRTVHNRSFMEIKCDRKHWQEWPVSALYNRWNNHLKHRSETTSNNIDIEPDAGNTNIQNEDLQEDGPLVTAECGLMTVESLQEPSVNLIHEDHRSSSGAHQLPTPSSLEYLEAGGVQQDAIRTSHGDVPPTSAITEYDEEDLELLSLVGMDDGDDNGIASSPPPDNTVLPSIEVNAVMEEVEEDDEPQPQLPPTDIPDSTTIRPHEKSAGPIILSSASKPKRKPIPVNFESDDELNLVDTGSSPSGNPQTGTTTCDICLKSFKSISFLHRHQRNPPSSHNTATTSRPEPNPEPSPDLVGQDELQIPQTPEIKCEHSTPPASFLLSIPHHHTPRSAPHPRHANSSAAQSTPKPRRSDHREIRQSWATKGRKSTPAPKTLSKRRSFQISPRKRLWEDDGGNSEDELAL
ncbi:hypothetical protein BDV95DRAFT_640904 [Massariosphaeria phaeospora]|uniref:C2H2-type domain-containing protein n=1 Tax=Massariosphaeria phaeospora TaxID=100035 RepID=A0A7C8I4S9_9PLEO|nr:hypothetical protein BDV95DRAFT_640904 [Massariosphaeria phaeospora]